MNLKKLIALLLALVLTFALAACANGEQDQQPTPSTDASVNDTDPTPSTDPQQSEETTVPQDVVTEPYTEENVSVPSSVGSYNIPAVLTVPAGEGPFPLVVMNHGFAGSKDENVGFIYIARRLAEAGIASIRMDFCGSGDSLVDFVEFSEYNAVSDSNDCLHYALENANIDEENLGIFGYSNGGVISAIIVAEEDCPYSVRVLLAPAVTVTFDGGAENLAIAEENGYVEMPWFGNTLHIGAEYYRSSLEFHENLDTYLQPSIDTLVIYGTEDTSVPPEHNETYAAAVNADVLRIYGANHGYGFYDTSVEGCKVMDTVAGGVVEYFGSRLLGSPAVDMFGE